MRHVSIVRAIGPVCGRLLVARSSSQALLSWAGRGGVRRGVGPTSARRWARRWSAALLCLTTAAAAGPVAAQQPQQQSVPYGNNPAAGRTLEVDGATIYYERYGSGRPVVLLHGGLFGDIDEFAGLIQSLQRDHTVIAIAMRGHGKSTMGPGRLTHQRIADDAAAVIRKEATEPVDVVGFSTGARAAYRLVVAHPTLVRRLVAIGGRIAASGGTEAGAAEAKVYATPDELEKRYPALVGMRKRRYANPGDWDRLVRAFAEIDAEPDIPEAAVRALTQPTLIVAGDRDHYNRTDHFVHIYKLLQHGSLAIVPRCGHVVAFCEPELVTQMVRRHLDRK